MGDPNQNKAFQEKAERDEADRERMEALGRDSDNPALLDAYQKNQAKLAAGRITEQEARRDLDKVEYLDRDKKRRDAARQEVAERDGGQQVAALEPKADWKALKDREQLQLTKGTQQSQNGSHRSEQNAHWKTLQKDPDRLREAQEQFREQQAEMLKRQDGKLPPGPGRELQ